MARNLSVINHADFSGGLNLRANQFSLKPNESPNMLNVDVDPRGGFRLRGGVAPYGPSATDANIHSLAQLHTTTGTDQLIAGWALKVGYSTGSSWTNIVTNQTVSTPFSAVQFKNALYIQNGTDKPLKWTGSASSRLDQTYADDFGSPGSAKMPIAKTVATHVSHVFVGNTLEGGTRFPHRIRFSHPNMPESYRTLDFIDVAPGVDGDEIVGLVSAGDHLLIVKKRGLYALYGSSWSDFSVQTVTTGLGAVGPKAVAQSPGGVFFFDSSQGVMLWTGRGLEWKFEPLLPYIDRSILSKSDLDETAMCWLNNRLWVTLPFPSGGRATFVMDPSLSKGGSWVPYFRVNPTTMIQWRTDDGDTTPMGVNDSTAYVIKVDRYDQPFDKFTPAGAETHIVSTYTTRWFDAGQPAVKKRWRRPQTVYFGEADDSVSVTLSKDYNRGDQTKTFLDAIGGVGPGGIWDDAGSTWDGTNDNDQWAPQIPIDYRITRGSPLGNAKAVQLRFDGPPDNVYWGVDSISLPYIPRKLR